MKRSRQNYNARRFIWANGLQGVGDQVVSAKTVLPWLLGAAGAPAFFVGLLVPVRESGAMLPQAALTPWVLTRTKRAPLWILGAAGQALTAALIALAALLLTGTPLGLAVLVLLALHAVSRALSSITVKDVQGRTISKGHRGVITGRATSLSGLVALVIGLGLGLLPLPLPTWVLAALIFAGAFAWLAALLVFRTIDEPVPDHPGDADTSHGNWWTDMWRMFFQDSVFRNFVVVRSLMLVTALSTSFVVLLSQEIGHEIAGLGMFVVAAALATLIGGRISGAASDLSSKSVMAIGAGASVAVIAAVVVTAQLWPDTVAPWALPVGFFLIQLAHTAVRVARKTYVVDMAEGDARTRYTGAANSLMGVILLVVGVISGVLAGWGATAALIFLAVVGVVGVFGATRLKDVSEPA